jgi:hypothetical protein
MQLLASKRCRNIHIASPPAIRARRATRVRHCKISHCKIFHCK